MNFLTPYLFWIKLAGIVALVAGLFGSGYHLGSKHETDKQAKTVIVTQTKVAVVNTKSVAEVNVVATDYVTLLNTQKVTHDEEMRKLKHKLSKLATCTIPGSIVGLLNPGSSIDMPNSSTIGQQPSSETETTGSTCAIELEVAARNYREVCIPNAEQLEAVQSAYNKVRDNINGFK